MDQQAVMEVANVVTKLKMYPYFDICNYILMCLIVREDTLPATTGKPWTWFWNVQGFFV